MLQRETAYGIDVQKCKDEPAGKFNGLEAKWNAKSEIMQGIIYDVTE